jgi:hypothetical protein
MERDTSLDDMVPTRRQYSAISDMLRKVVMIDIAGLPPGPFSLERDQRFQCKINEHKGESRLYVLDKSSKGMKPASFSIGPSGGLCLAHNEMNYAALLALTKALVMEFGSADAAGVRVLDPKDFEEGEEGQLGMGVHAQDDKDGEEEGGEKVEEGGPEPHTRAGTRFKNMARDITIRSRIN